MCIAIVGDCTPRDWDICPKSQHSKVNTSKYCDLMNSNALKNFSKFRNSSPRTRFGKRVSVTSRAIFRMNVSYSDVTTHIASILVMSAYLDNRQAAILRTKSDCRVIQFIKYARLPSLRFSPMSLSYHIFTVSSHCVATCTP